MAIKLIVGLGNPGKDYQQHRHNVGFWFVNNLANFYGVNFKSACKFFGEVALIKINQTSVRLLKPTTYMNRSGQSIQSLAKFYQISAEEILIIHDELDLPSGAIKLKFSGGHGGHNGLRDAVKALNTQNFFRFRVGIGRPSEQSKVADFVLHMPNKHELVQIEDALLDAQKVLELVVAGKSDEAMKTLHTKDN
jgi:PTH1 family peptidyl-tRNA hydrolase